MTTLMRLVVRTRTEVTETKRGHYGAHKEFKYVINSIRPCKTIQSFGSTLCVFVCVCTQRLAVLVISVVLVWCTYRSTAHTFDKFKYKNELYETSTYTHANIALFFS